jgi:RNA polymerase sigma-70 factor, ECF subfamily
MPLAFTRTGSTPATFRPAAVEESSTDQMLIERIADGDQLALRSLFGRHQTRVYRFVLRLVRNETTAEDVVSDVFLDVWRQARQFEARASVSTWIYSIARFKALSAMRRRTNVELNGDMMANIPDPADDPEAALQRKNSAEVLRRGLARLSAVHAEVIDLVYYHGKSVKEVAEIIGISEATVKTRMFYARKKLNELLPEGTRMALHQ